MLSRSDLGPEQRQTLERCRAKLRQLGRIKDPPEKEVYRYIDEIVEGLIEAFSRRDGA